MRRPEKVQTGCVTWSSLLTRFVYGRRDTFTFTPQFSGHPSVCRTENHGRGGDPPIHWNPFRIGERLEQNRLFFTPLTLLEGDLHPPSTFIKSLRTPCSVSSFWPSTTIIYLQFGDPSPVVRLSHPSQPWLSFPLNYLPVLWVLLFSSPPVTVSVDQRGKDSSK